MPIGYTKGYSAILLIGFVLFLIAMGFKGISSIYNTTTNPNANWFYDWTNANPNTFWGSLAAIIISVILVFIGGLLFAYKPSSTVSGNYTSQYLNGSISLFVIAGIILLFVLSIFSYYNYPK